MKTYLVKVNTVVLLVISCFAWADPNNGNGRHHWHQNGLQAQPTTTSSSSTLQSTGQDLQSAESSVQQDASSTESFADTMKSDASSIEGDLSQGKSLMHGG